MSTYLRILSWITRRSLLFLTSYPMSWARFITKSMKFYYLHISFLNLFCHILWLISSSIIPLWSTSVSLEQLTWTLLVPRVNIIGTPNKTKLMKKIIISSCSTPKKFYNIVIQKHKHTHTHPKKAQCSQKKFPYLEILHILTE